MYNITLYINILCTVQSVSFLLPCDPPTRRDAAVTSLPSDSHGNPRAVAFVQQVVAWLQGHSFLIRIIKHYYFTVLHAPHTKTVYGGAAAAAVRYRYFAGTRMILITLSKHAFSLSLDQLVICTGGKITTHNIIMAMKNIS